MEGDVYKGGKKHLALQSGLKMVRALGIRHYGQISLATLFLSARAVRIIHLMTFNFLCFNK